MEILKDVHHQFAAYFQSPPLKPWLYLLSKKLSEGHTCIDASQSIATNWEEAGYETVVPITELLNDPLVADGSKNTPFVFYNERLYLARYFNYETIILEKIRALVASGRSKNKEREAALLEQAGFIINLFKTSSPSKDINWPLAAAISSVLNDFTIITGGPGTGKTTTVAKILAILFTINDKAKVALTAPTGKAAARMAESLLKNASQFPEAIQEQFESLEPATLHRLLGISRNSPNFKYNRQNPLRYDVVIADESSMIDLALFAKLLDAVGPGTKLILLGDKDQLASVEAGSLFGDLCLSQSKQNGFTAARRELINSFITNTEQQVTSEYGDQEDANPLFEHIIELQRSHRFSDDKGIGKFSKAIIRNNQEGMLEFLLNQDEQVYIDTEYSKKIFDNFISGYRSFIEEEDILGAITKLNNLRILCAVRDGDQGVNALNKKVEFYLKQQNLVKPTIDFYEHRPIMITSNNKELQLFNGDTGIIRKDHNGILKAWFQGADGQVRSVLPGYISTAETVFAMTIHKSQGSEFDQVLVALPHGEDIPILTRELLYTAVTRAKTKVIVQGSKSLLLHTATASVQRGSGIISRLNSATG